ncbi:L-threonylcarbamoyladenylate synthase [Raoultibacter phocaeensis]|uniref:L-threonylcarbamoyladenylate synthase n=1 Tax=Raoultibacter phocaeensis TaxID=2479841 RepID=UPI002106603B|nr:L-threonylcarbamoyladenylate synthase [Raoultibacter phocaeensis]
MEHDMPDEHNLTAAVAALSAGQPVIFPTDTVYGLGVAVGVAETPEILYDIKERDHGKPVAWLVANPEALALYGAAVPEFACVLARTFWPGPLTLVVKAGANVPGPFQSESGTIALRMPDNELALSLIGRLGVPLATTSANISGQKPPRSFDELDEVLLGRVQVAVRDGSEKSGVASSVVDCTGDHPVMVREGGVSIADIQALG